MRAFKNPNSRPIHFLQRLPQFDRSHFGRVRLEAGPFLMIVPSFVDLEIVGFEMVMKLVDEERSGYVAALVPLLMRTCRNNCQSSNRLRGKRKTCR